MKRRSGLLWGSHTLMVVVVLVVLAACSGGGAQPPASVPTLPPSNVAPTTASGPTAVATKAAAASPAANKTAAPASSPTPLPKGAVTCPAAVPLPANAQLAARVNGQGISLDLYNRQVTQAQNAMVQVGGVDAKSAQGQDVLNSVKQQVLDQMIDDTVVAQQAAKEGVQVTEDELNGRIAQMIQDAGGMDKFNEYLGKNQLSMTDFCTQMRGQLIGEKMFARVTEAYPSQAEQVHVRHILVASAQLAQQIHDQLVAGKDFATLAKQYSVDEATKDNGGDLGWVPKGVMAPEFDAVAFQLKPGEISQVIQTQLGFQIIKVEEHADSRPLPPDLLQPKRQQAFLAWVHAVRDTLKVERLVQ